MISEMLIDEVLMKENSMLLYPNPANEEVNVLYNLGSEAGIISVEIFDITGRAISTYNVDITKNILKINTQKYNRGIYYVMLIVDGKRMKVEKLVIQ